MEFDPVSFAMGVSSASVDPELADATATRADILYPKTAYLANGHKNTGTMQSLAAATFTPSATTQTIPAGKYLAGDQTIIGDANLVANNIRKNVSIFGVTGNYEGQVVVDNKPVRFIDYDGTVVYTYTPEEFAALLELPANPSHEGLVAQGWNWTLADAKTHVADYGSLDIGQMYTTASGATEIDIKLEAPYLSPYLVITNRDPITIDWDDGSELQQINENNKQFIQHNYNEAGNYTIKITGNDYVFIGRYNQIDAGILLPTGAPTSSSLYSSTIQAIRLGINATIGLGAFMYCNQMKYISIPMGEDKIAETSFYYCSSLKGIVIPKSATLINDGAFKGCFSLENISIPKGITSIGVQAFYNCLRLKNIILPSSLTIIKLQAFYNCSSLNEVYLPNSVTSCEESIFANCNMLSSVKIFYSSYNAISSSIFISCPNLIKIQLPAVIKYIYANAFSDCSSLQKITIPSTVTDIYGGALAYCLSLSEIHFLPSTPPTVKNSNAFANLPTNCTIYVPSGSLSAYTSATNYPSSSTYTYVEE